MSAKEVANKLFLSTPSVRRATDRFSQFMPEDVQFLSTPSVRRATIANKLNEIVPDISIHALREEGDRKTWNVRDQTKISIHALREEGDTARKTKTINLSQFLSTPSVRRATLTAVFASKFFYFISIHALREEGDGR